MKDHKINIYVKEIYISTKKNNGIMKYIRTLTGDILEYYKIIWPWGSMELQSDMQTLISRAPHTQIPTMRKEKMSSPPKIEQHIEI